MDSSVKWYEQGDGLEIQDKIVFYFYLGLQFLYHIETVS